MSYAEIIAKSCGEEEEEGEEEEGGGEEEGGSIHVSSYFFSIGNDRICTLLASLCNINLSYTLFCNVLRGQ